MKYKKPTRVGRTSLESLQKQYHETNNPVTRAGLRQIIRERRSMVYWFTSDFGREQGTHKDFLDSPWI